MKAHTTFILHPPPTTYNQFHEISLWNTRLCLMYFSLSGTISIKENYTKLFRSFKNFPYPFDLENFHNKIEELRPVVQLLRDTYCQTTSNRRQNIGNPTVPTREVIRKPIMSRILSI